jgi:hypothetical protein
MKQTRQVSYGAPVGMLHKRGCMYGYSPLVRTGYTVQKRSGKKVRDSRSERARSTHNRRLSRSRAISHLNGPKRPRGRREIATRTRLACTNTSTIHATSPPAPPFIAVTSPVDTSAALAQTIGHNRPSEECIAGSRKEGVATELLVLGVYVEGGVKKKKTKQKTRATPNR